MVQVREYDTTEATQRCIAGMLSFPGKAAIHGEQDEAPVAHGDSASSIDKRDGPNVVLRASGLQAPGSAAVCCAENRAARSHDDSGIGIGEGHRIKQAGRTARLCR